MLPQRGLPPRQASAFHKEVTPGRKRNRSEPGLKCEPGRPRLGVVNSGPLKGDATC